MRRLQVLLVRREQGLSLERRHLRWSAVSFLACVIFRGDLLGKQQILIQVELFLPLASVLLLRGRIAQVDRLRRVTQLFVFVRPPEF